jgi:hypothetical protein
MKTKYVIQFRSGPLKGQFVGRWSEHGWVFTTERLIKDIDLHSPSCADNSALQCIDIGPGEALRSADVAGVKTKSRTKHFLSQV